MLLSFDALALGLIVLAIVTEGGRLALWTRGDPAPAAETGTQIVQDLTEA